MKDFLADLKADLLDRRLMPLVLLACFGLIAAVGWVALDSGSSSGGAVTTANVPPSSGPTDAGGISVTALTPQKALAETTGGTAGQTQGVSHNPFAPIAGSKAKAGTKDVLKTGEGLSKTGTSSSGSSSASGSSSGSTTKTSEPPAKTKATETKQTIYQTTALFGVVTAGTPAADAQLNPFQDMKLLTALPDTLQPLLVYRGVTSGGKAATFTVVGEVILHGAGTCLPSAQQCEAIDLKPGKSEQLEYLPTSGPTVTYELRLVSIEAQSASGATVSRYVRHRSKAGWELLVQDGRVTLPYLRESTQPGVLVFPRLGARARASRRAAHGR